MAEAGPGEVLVSRSVRDSVEGADFQFEDRGSRALKGVTGERRLYAVTAVPKDGGLAVPGRWSGNILRRRALVGAALVGALLLGIAALYVSRRDAVLALTPEELLAADAAPGIAVLPFSVSDPDLAEWREGMGDLLSVNLDGVFDLRAIDQGTVLARWAESVPDIGRADLATALAVARRTGARYAVLGTVVAAGVDLRLTADVYEARSGTRLGHAQVTGAPDRMMSLVDRLTRELLEALPREEGVLANVDLAELTTDSLAALKAYLSGEALYRRADFQGAATEYERAIASDSTFALAWARVLDSCGWGSGSKLCEREPPWEREEFLRHLPPRKAELMQAQSTYWSAPIDFEPLQRMVLKYPDDPVAWYVLGDMKTHFGAWGLLDPEEGDRALERAIALAPRTGTEPYLHLIQHALADADSARAARLLDAFQGITRGAAAQDYVAALPLAFAIGFGDSVTRAETRAALDTVPTGRLVHALSLLGNPRLHGVIEEALQVALARSDNQNGVETFGILYGRGNLRAALDFTNEERILLEFHEGMLYRLYQVGSNLPREELERIFAVGATDSTSGVFAAGAYAADRGQWDQHAAALDRARARDRYWQAEGTAHQYEIITRALEGYALWKRGQKSEAIRVLEAAQRESFGGEPHRGAPWMLANVTLRWWLGELMLEVGRPRDAERYFKTISSDPFAALRLAKVYENLGEFEKARSSYEYALLSWHDADPELQPRIQEARRALARLPKPLRRERS
jgi:tetratricopeptide (TPR) repeat protein